MGAPGVITGNGGSVNNGAFNIGGRLDASGSLMMATGIGGALYTGRFDHATGALNGTWQYVAGRSGGGSFSGQRQR